MLVKRLTNLREHIDSSELIPINVSRHFSEGALRDASSKSEMLCHVMSAWLCHWIMSNCSRQRELCYSMALQVMAAWVTCWVARPGLDWSHMLHRAPVSFKCIQLARLSLNAKGLAYPWALIEVSLKNGSSSSIRCLSLLLHAYQCVRRCV